MVLCGATAAMVGVLTFARTPVSRAAFREAMLPLWTTTTPDIRYGPFPRNVLDVLQPRAAQSDPRPIVIVFHGGAWRDGSRAEMRDRVCRRYLSQGFVVANVDYRPGIEESVEDAECALKWVSSNAERLEADPRRVVITGES